MSRPLRLISHPFHNGLPGVDMGAGPLRLLAGTLDADGRMGRAAAAVISTIGRRALPR